jgi:hypothetical protein
VFESIGPAMLVQSSSINEEKEEEENGLSIFIQSLATPILDHEIDAHTMYEINHGYRGTDKI